MKHLDIKVYGKVQGVFFRASAKEKASELRLNGYVKNDSDGSLNIEIEGEDAEVDKFKKWCEEGPPSAKVDRIDASIGPIRGYK